jgi:hypothetical protein
MHSTVKCFKLLARAACKTNAGSQNKTGNGNTTSNANANKPFSKWTFRKEVNALVRKAGRKDMLEICATALKRKQARVSKTAKKTSKKKSSKQESESEESSESDKSMHNLEERIPRKRTTELEMLSPTQAPRSRVLTDEEIQDLCENTWDYEVQDLVEISTGTTFTNPYAHLQGTRPAKYLHNKAKNEFSLDGVEVEPFSRSRAKKVSFAKENKKKITDQEVEPEEQAFLLAVDQLEKKSNKEKKKKATTNKKNLKAPPPEVTSDNELKDSNK